MRPAAAAGLFGLDWGGGLRKPASFGMGRPKPEAASMSLGASGAHGGSPTGLAVPPLVPGGAYAGPVHTRDGKRPRVQVPCRLRLAQGQWPGSEAPTAEA